MPNEYFNKNYSEIIYNNYFIRKISDEIWLFYVDFQFKKIKSVRGYPLAKIKKNNFFY